MQGISPQTESTQSSSGNWKADSNLDFDNLPQVSKNNLKKYLFLSIN